MLENAFTFGKLLVAHNICRRSKQHKRETVTFELNISYNLAMLSREILNRTYGVGKYREFKIYEPKERSIEALTYRDRVVLMALCTNIIEPRLEKRLINDNTACRKGKGTHYGITRLATFMQEHYREHGNEGYCLKCDVRKYFQSIDHGVLFEMIKKVGFDADELWLMKKIIDSRNGDTGVGLPIGNQTSQWFALLYLDVIDRLVKEKLKIKHYVRYMDDMILVHPDKEYLKHCKEEIERTAKEVLHLSLNNKTVITKLTKGIDFLGFRHILTPTGKVLRLLRGQAKTRIRHNIRRISRMKETKKVDDKYVNERRQSYAAHLKHSHSKKYFNALLVRYKLDK